jgi:hypothetical protein
MAINESVRVSWVSTPGNACLLMSIREVSADFDTPRSMRGVSVGNELPRVNPTYRNFLKLGLVCMYVISEIVNLHSYAYIPPLRCKL